MAKKKKLTIHQYIIEKYIKNSKPIWSDREATKREISTAKKLLAKFPDKKFWVRAPIPYDKMESLLWFLTPDGKEYLIKAWNTYKLDIKPKVRHNIDDRKYGRAKKVKPKAKKLFDFLRENENGSEEEN